MAYDDDLLRGILDQLAVAGESLSLSRDGQSVTIVGIFGNPLRHVDRGEVAVSSDESSFLIKASSYQPLGEVTEPRIGDRITRESGQVWEVRRPSDGSDYVEDYGGRSLAWRVRCTRVRSSET